MRANSAALGLDAADLDGLDLQRRAAAPGGLTVVHFRQLYRGIPAFDNDLRVAIDRAGRVLSVAGAPRHDLAVDSVEPSISGAAALARLQRNVGVERSLPVRSGPTGARRTTTFEGGDFARLVLFGTASEAKLAWHVTYRASSTAFYDAVVDATSGRDPLPPEPDQGRRERPGLPQPSERQRARDGGPRGLRPARQLDGARRRVLAPVGRPRRRRRRRRGRGDDAELGHGLRPSVHALHPGRDHGLHGAEPCAWDTTSTGTRTDDEDDRTDSRTACRPSTSSPASTTTSRAPPSASRTPRATSRSAHRRRRPC